MRVWLQIQGSWVRSRSGPILSWRLIMKWFLQSFSSLPFWPHPLDCGCACGQNICYHVAASVVSFNLICNMTTFRKKYSLTFWPHPLGWGCVCGQNICYHVAASIVSFNLICNMTTFRKKYSLTFWPHPLGWGCVCGQNICYHVAASIVSFNLICNMTIFWKSLILTSAPPPKSTQHWTGLDPGLQIEILFDMFHIYCCSACMQNFSKKY